MAPNGEKRYAISRNGEIYRGDYASREEAMQSVDDEFSVEPGATLWVRACVPWVPQIRGYPIWEQVAEDACRELPLDLVDDLPALTPEEETSLGRHLTLALHAWMQEHRKWSGWFCVVDGEQFVYVPRPADEGSE